MIDFDSVVKNTKVAKSIILISGFSNTTLHSRNSETTNMNELSPRGLTVAGLNQIRFQKFRWKSRGLKSLLSFNSPLPRKQKLFQSIQNKIKDFNFQPRIPHLQHSTIPISIHLKPATVSPQREAIPYICGLGARFGCERISERSNRRD